MVRMEVPNVNFLGIDPDSVGSNCGLIEVVASHEIGPALSGEHPNRIVIGVDRERRGCTDPSAFDLLLTEKEGAASPWIEVSDLDETLAQLRADLDRNPVASLALVQVLRATERLDFANALAVESLTYSMLLAGSEFAKWRAETPRRSSGDLAQSRVRVGFEREIAQIRLTRANARNAFDARMRDELYDALQFAAAESATRPIALSGDGPDFCAGGDLNEFGTAVDPSLAHAIRMVHSPVRLLYRLRDRVTAKVHGACVGAGIELPAAASKIVAKPDAWFKLPEVSMGLIPGAGGTVTIPRRIGRHRTCYFALSGERQSAADALRWGLIDDIAY